MSTEARKVSTRAELLAAAADRGVGTIAVAADLTDLPTFRLSPGQTLVAANRKLVLSFAAGQDGLQLSTDNRVEGLELSTDPDKRALFNDTGVERLGRLVLTNLRITGVVQLLAAGGGFETI